MPPKRGVALHPVAVTPDEVGIATDLVVAAGEAGVVLGHRLAAGTDDVGRVAARALLVVAHQHDLGAAADAARAHHTHAVVSARRHEPVAHQVTTPAVALVAEARRQLDQRQAGRQVVGGRGHAIGAGNQQRRIGGDALTARRAAHGGGGFGRAAGQGGDRRAEGGGDGSAAAHQQAAAGGIRGGLGHRGLLAVMWEWGNPHARCRP